MACPASGGWGSGRIPAPTARFPEALHPAIRALPLTALNEALRAVINEGALLAASWLEMAVLAAWGVVGFALALRIFCWQ